MKSKYNRITCFILAVFVLISGFGLENIQKNTSFLVFADTQKQSSIFSQSGLGCNTQNCVISVLREDEELEELLMYNARCKYSRSIQNDIKSYFAFLLRKDQYMNFIEKILAEQEVELVTQYIHELDGKKRI